MKLRVAVPLLAICLASPAISSGDQVKKGRGYTPRESGGGQAAEKPSGDTNSSGNGRERTADTNSGGERRPETRTADRAPEPQRYAVPKDSGGGYVDNRSRDNRPVIVTRNRPDINIINIGSSYRGPRYYPPAQYDYWTRHYYSGSPIGYAPWLISGSIGYSNFGFYGGGPGPYAVGPYYYPYNGYGYGSYPYSPWQAGGYDIGGIRLKIRPRDAQVFVDGYYAGLVDDFDGTFQSLRLEAGGHKIEIHMPGFQDFELDVHVQPGRTITLDQDLRLRP
jgi:hypothetical protein